MVHTFFFVFFLTVKICLKKSSLYFSLMASGHKIEMQPARLPLRGKKGDNGGTTKKPLEKMTSFSLCQGG